MIGCWCVFDGQLSKLVHEGEQSKQDACNYEQAYSETFNKLKSQSDFAIKCAWIIKWPLYKSVTISVTNLFTKILLLSWYKRGIRVEYKTRPY